MPQAYSTILYIITKAKVKDEVTPGSIILNPSLRKVFNSELLQTSTLVLN